MAQEFQAAVRAAAPLLILDEDRSATNPLVPGCLQSGEVTPLATLLATRREALGETGMQLPSHQTVLELLPFRQSHFAASSLDILIARDRPDPAFSGHEAWALDRGEFRRRLDVHLVEVREHLAEDE